MDNAELIAALRYCSSHGCGRCVALDASEFCSGNGIAGIMNSAADLIEAQAKRIAELNTKCADLQSQINSMGSEIEELMPKEGEWISVEDRLPQPKELVIVARKDGFVSLGYCFQFGENHLWSAIRLIPFSPYELPFVGAGHITHWMPLPEPPKGEQE